MNERQEWAFFRVWKGNLQRVSSERFFLDDGLAAMLDHVQVFGGILLLVNLQTGDTAASASVLGIVEYDLTPSNR